MESAAGGKKTGYVQEAETRIGVPNCFIAVVAEGGSDGTGDIVLNAALISRRSCPL